MLALAVCFASLNSQLAEVSYDQFSGLSVALSGVPLITSSEFQYFDSKTGKGIYSSKFAPKQVTRLPDGSIQVRYNGDNGNAIGTHTYLQTSNGCKIRYEFRWRGSNTVRVENCLGKIWAPAISNGEIRADGSGLLEFAKPIHGDWASRKLASASNFEFKSQVADIHLQVSNSRANLYDARLYDQDWANNDCLFWLGQSQITVKPGETTEVTAEWTWDLRPQRLPDPVLLNPKATEVAKVALAHEYTPRVIPQPKSWIQKGGTTEITGQGPTHLEPTVDFAQLISEDWQIKPEEVTIPITWIKRNPLAHPESYTVDIRPSEVQITAESRVEFQHALQTLRQLVYAKQGKLILPLCKIEDYPSVAFRGAHLISGKSSHPFLSTFAKKVLARAKLNRAVVDVSRTQWDAVPKGQGKDWQTKSQVANLFSQLRSNNFQPIPLIQSLGHMEWLLNGELSSLAIDPDVPFILDVRKAQARKLSLDIWQEAVQLLHSQIAHFGMDEVSRRGMKDDPTLATRLWKQQLTNLSSFATSHDLVPMLWGDMMLAPGDAPDATHAADQQAAKQFRALLPKNAMICDWHYAAQNNPDKYASLALWKREGFRTIASSWWRPENIRNHTLEAIDQGAGTLQTTWAGYSNDEQTLLAQPEQFSAQILAGEYSWSGRSEPVAKLGYDPDVVLRDWLFAPKFRLTSSSGFQIAQPLAGMKSIKIGDFNLPIGSPVSLSTPLTGSGASGFREINIAVNRQASLIAIACDAIGWQREGEKIAEVVVETDTGEVRRFVTYGGDVRAKEDDRTTIRSASAEGKSAFVALDLNAKTLVKRVRIVPISATAGFRFYGLSGVE